MQGKSITIESRNDFGKNASRRLRKSGYIPAILYSHGESESVKVLRKDFMNLFDGKVSESIIFDIPKKDSTDKKEQMAFVKSYQLDPVTDDIIHIDLFKVTAGEKIHTHVSLKFIGEAKGLKLDGVLEIMERTLNIECLPRDLPDKIEIDITELLIGDSIHVKDLKLDEKIHILANMDTTLVAVHAKKIVEEEVEEEIEGIEGEEGVEGEEIDEEDTEKEDDKTTKSSKKEK